MRKELKNGFIVYDKDEMGKNELVIEEVEVYAKRQGTGKKLVEFVIGYAKRNGYDAVTGYAYPQDDTIDKDALVEFYENCGFDIEYDDGEGALVRYDL